MKRLTDVVVASVALVLLSPVLAAVALSVRLVMGRPVLFRQPRPGLGGAVFEILKFRTMRPPLAPGREFADHDERIPPLGRFLRRTSLDELPELLNVLRGEMSLVGPRPLLVDYLDRYTPEQARRHDVRPGITGLAQVSGRNALDWEQTFALDVRYVDTRSWWMDVRILLLTLVRLLDPRGAGADAAGITPMFLGSRTPPAAATDAGTPGTTR
ncbi:sugar transferase [Cellulomonas aerilata]|uniref:Sugar transferase n=1 Tax=Cellulomonas aerilata TaxID=515326 RepID=A0A512DCB0_9CELL|nr:sugar transferase [Cellulomonas aerilata]GEO34119.1 sugar transferase [Cellulomonas aerilata]